MRITEKIIFSQVDNNLQKNVEKLVRLQNSLSTGKRISTPSDDPIGNSRILSYSSLSNRIDQYLKNMDRGIGTLSIHDSTLSQTTNLLNRTRELAVQMRSDTTNSDDRVNASREVRQILRQLSDLGNTKNGDEYLYSGDGIHGQFVGGSVSFPVTITTGSNDTLQVVVDGIQSGVVTLASGSYTGVTMAAEIQSKINADATLGSKDVMASFDSVTGKISIRSSNYGDTSSVDVVGGTSRTSIGLTGGTSTSGSRPFTLSTSSAAGARNSGTGMITTGTVTDDSQATLDDYLIKFTSASQFSLYRLSGGASASDASPSPSNAVINQASVINTGQLTLDAYQIQFTSATTYNVVDTTQGTTISSGNAYVSGTDIEFDGLRVAITDGSSGGPVAGNIFSVNPQAALVSSGNNYTSGSAINVDGLSVTVSGVPVTNDAFSLSTKYVFNGDTHDRRIVVGENETAAIGLSGGNVLSGAGGGADLFAILKDFYNSLQGNNGAGIETALGQVDTALDQIARYQAEVGARFNYLDTTKQNLDAFQTNIAILRSGVEDVDLIKTSSDLEFQQAAVQAAMQSTAMLMQPTLLSFLK